jgi:uncharacterized repeat protein (TIGR03803 family)
MNAISKWTTALGITTVLASAVTTQSAQAQRVQTKNPDTFTTLHNFNEDYGNSPYTGLIQATNGNLYGTTYLVYGMTPSGTIVSDSLSIGANVVGLLMQATDGSLYGTGETGGEHEDGAIFDMIPGSDAPNVLYSFCVDAYCADGKYPYSGPLVQSNKFFYGTTSEGGASAVSAPPGYGTIFKISPKGTLTTLHSFCAQTNCADGEYPYAGLIQTANGDFYGTTFEGGVNGAGTVFKVTSGGTLTTLYSFCAQADCTDGEYPYAGLIQAANGDFYGTTESGGAHGYGTVFKITAHGKLTTLYSFCSQSDCADGDDSHAGLIQASDGDFYGTTASGEPTAMVRFSKSPPAAS